MKKFFYILYGTDIVLTVFLTLNYIFDYFKFHRYGGLLETLYVFLIELPVLLLSPVFLIMTLVLIPVFAYRNYKGTISLKDSNIMLLLSLVQFILTFIMWRVFIFMISMGV